jgi:hypothetical protein
MVAQWIIAAFLIGGEKKNWLIEPYHVIFGLTFM